MACRLTLALVGCLFAASAWAGPVGEELLVEVVANGRTLPDFADVVMDEEGRFWAPSELWASMGVVLTDDETDSLSHEQLDLEVEFDASTQRLTVSIPGERLPSQRVGANRQPIGELSPMAPGLLVNYDLAGSWRQGGGVNLSMGHEARMGLAGGVLSTTGQMNLAGGDFEYRRGLTTWSRDVISRRGVLQAGDVFTPRSALGGTVNLGGVRWASDSSLRPEESTWPVPVLGGLVQDASMLDLYLNERRRNQHRVDAGPFEFDDIPLIRGDNRIELLVRDEFGREQRIVDRLYFNPTLLRPGLTEWDVALGAVRIPGSDSYGDPALAATMSRGMTDSFTLNARVEGTADAQVVGVGGAATLGRFGFMTGEVAQSRSDQGSGHAWTVGYEYQAQRWSMRASHSQWSDDYWDLSRGSFAGTSSMPSQSSQIGFGYRPESARWSANVSAVEQRRADGGRMRRLDAQARIQLASGDLGVGVTYDPVHNDPGVALTYRHRFGNTRSAAASFRQTGDGRQDYGLNAQGRSEIAGQTLRWQGGARSGDLGDRAFVRGGMNLRQGEADARLDWSDSGTSANARWSGSVYVGPGLVSAQAPVRSSYLVVEVPGQEGVPITVDGNSIGTTNRNGLAFAPRATDHRVNRVGLDTSALDFSVALESTTLRATPARNAGAVARFEVLTETMLEVQLTGPEIPPGSRASTPAERVPVGFDGILVLEEPEAGETIDVSWAGGQCQARLPAPLPSLEDRLRLSCD